MSLTMPFTRCSSLARAAGAARCIPVGTNVLNERTIAESARGLADYVALGKGEGYTRSCVIAHDTRHHSAEFARLCARVMAAAGFKVFLFKEPRSTPLLSFSVRHLHCDAGIMVTASHNPPSDNGFKCYGRSGGQVIPPDDAGIIACVARGLGPRDPRKGHSSLPSRTVRFGGSDRRRFRLYRRGRERVGLPCARYLHRLHTAPRRRRDLGRAGARRLRAFAGFTFWTRNGRPTAIFPTCRTTSPTPNIPERSKPRSRTPGLGGGPGDRERSRRRSHRRRGARLA